MSPSVQNNRVALVRPHTKLPEDSKDLENLNCLQTSQFEIYFHFHIKIVFPNRNFLVSLFSQMMFMY